MWALVTELLVGAWLLASPAVLPSFLPESRIVPWVAGVVILALSGVSFTERCRGYHLGNLGVAAILLAWGWLQTPRPGPAWAQNLILSGLLLGLMAVVPSRASRPPEGWRSYVARRDHG